MAAVGADLPNGSTGHLVVVGVEDPYLAVRGGPTGRADGVPLVVGDRSRVVTGDSSVIPYACINRTFGRAFFVRSSTASEMAEPP
jgi:hypothetical protein